MKTFGIQLLKEAFSTHDLIQYRILEFCQHSISKPDFVEKKTERIIHRSVSIEDVKD